MAQPSADPITTSDGKWSRPTTLVTLTPVAIPYAAKPTRGFRYSDAITAAEDQAITLWFDANEESYRTPD